MTTQSQTAQASLPPRHLSHTQSSIPLPHRVATPHQHSTGQTPTTAAHFLPYSQHDNRTLHNLHHCTLDSSPPTASHQQLIVAPSGQLIPIKYTINTPQHRNYRTIATTQHFPTTAVSFSPIRPSLQRSTSRRHSVDLQLQSEVNEAATSENYTSAASTPRRRASLIIPHLKYISPRATLSHNHFNNNNTQTKLLSNELINSTMNGERHSSQLLNHVSTFPSTHTSRHNSPNKSYTHHPDNDNDAIQQTSTDTQTSVSNRDGLLNNSDSQFNDLVEVSARVAAHRQAIADDLKVLLRKHNCCHWIGLSTDQRKQVALQLTQEHLVNPQECQTKYLSTTVAWEVKSFWTSREIEIICIKHSEPKLPGQQRYTTIYRILYDENGKLVRFDDETKTGEKTCVVM